MSQYVLCNFIDENQKPKGKSYIYFANENFNIGDIVKTKSGIKLIITQLNAPKPTNIEMLGKIKTVYPLNENIEPPKKYVIPNGGINNRDVDMPDTNDCKCEKCKCPELLIFRLIAREFAELKNSYICEWICLTRKWVSRKQFRAVYEDAVALLTAHRLKLARLAEDNADGTNYPVSSISEDGGSESYAIPNINLDMSMAGLKESSYGRLFLAARQPTMFV